LKRLLETTKRMINQKQKKELPSLPPAMIAGAGGFVGSSVLSSIKEKFQQLFTPSRNELDITKPENLLKFLGKYSPKVIVNFAAFTDINEAEKQRGERKGSVWLINVGGVKNLVRICEDDKIFLIHVSTDAVFPGTNNFPGPYSETQVPPNNPGPLSWYGYTKLQGELMLTNSKARYALVRISYPFGHKNCPKDFVNKVNEYVKKGLPLFSDQKFTPTYLPDLADTIFSVAFEQIEGTFHVTTHPLTSPYEFGAYLAKNLAPNADIKKSQVKEYLKTPHYVPRPIHGGLLTKKTEKKLSIRFHSWKDAIEEFTH